MEIRKLSQKAVAGRHDLNYFKKGSPIRHLQWKLAAGAIATSLIWLAVASFTHGRELFSKGPISSSHAIFGAKCEVCHVNVNSAFSLGSGFRRRVTDTACQSCHQVPDHQAKLALASFAAPECSGCHIEHTGSIVLAHAPDKGCVTCHADLKNSHYASNIHSFTSGHPQFAPLRAGYEDNQNIKFNHQAHMQKGLKGANGLVDLNCADCHRTPAAQTLTAWRFGTTTQASEALLSLRQAQPDPLHPSSTRAYFAITTYAESCHNCHTLKFDKHVTEEAPHASPQEVRKFIREKIQAYADQYPDVVSAEISNWTNDSAAKLLQAELTPPPHNTEEWVAARTRQAERSLWYQSCNLCHVMKIPDDSPTGIAASSRSTRAETLPAQSGLPGESLPLPTVAPTNQKIRWFENAVFSHQSHIAVSCESCHTRTRISTQATDILIPGIESCQKCHDGKSSPQGPALASGHAESGCFLCHRYHNWNYPSIAPIAPRNLEFKQISELDELR